MKTIQELQSAFETYLKDQEFTQSPTTLYEPINYIMQLGGKRLRPVLLLMAYQLYKDQVSPALPAAYAIEVFHNFSLVHDDIMDEAPLRRGKPTVHSTYGTNAGILSGDVMMIYAYDFLLKYTVPTQTVALLKTFTKVAIEVCEGQQMDMNFEEQSDVEIESYLKMIELKTAALIGGSIEMGAILAGASAADIQNLALFGRNIGIAFQLQDDILDTFGDPEKFGKKVGGDIAQNKKTYLMLKALELADADTRKALEHYLNDKSVDEAHKISAVTAIFRKLDIPVHAEAVKSTYRKKAFDYLDKVNVPANKKEKLQKLAEKFVQREV